MLNYSEIRERRYIVHENEPYEVVENRIVKKQRQKPTNQTKLRNLINGNIKQVTFHQSDVVHEADIQKKKVIFLFKKDNRQTGELEYWFNEKENPKNRFFLTATMLEGQSQYIKENGEIDALLFEDEVIGITLPIKVALEVTEAAPAVKGNTATGATKQVVVETGLIVNVPLFIKEGDIINVKTETGDYTERTV